MFRTEALPPIADVDEETNQRAATAVYGEVSLCCIKLFFWFFFTIRQKGALTQFIFNLGFNCLIAFRTS